MRVNEDAPAGLITFLRLQLQNRFPRANGGQVVG